MTLPIDTNLPAGEPGPSPADAGGSNALEGLAVKRRSPAALAWRRFLRNRLAAAALVVMVILVLGVIFLPMFMNLDPYTVDPLNIRAKPSAEHLLGTDNVGRDVFARLVYGGRVSLGIGISAALLTTLLGAIIGALAGTFGGWVDSVLMRMADVFMSFPSIVAMIIVIGIFGGNVVVLVLLLAMFNWISTARVVRAVILSLREREYVQASRAFGAKPGWLITRHLLPAALSQVVVILTLEVAGLTLTEAALSFLGFGIQPPTASWGNMLQAAQQYTVISSMPWLWLPPGLCIAITVLAINFIGDGLRDALDPRQR